MKQHSIDDILPSIPPRRHGLQNFLLGSAFVITCASTALFMQQESTKKKLYDIATIYPHQKGIIPAPDEMIAISKQYNVNPELVLKLFDIIREDWPTKEELKKEHYELLARSTGILPSILREDATMLTHAVASRLSIVREQLPGTLQGTPALITVYWIPSKEILDRAVSYATADDPNIATYGPLGSRELADRVQQYERDVERFREAVRTAGWRIPAEQELLGTATRNHQSRFTFELVLNPHSQNSERGIYPSGGAFPQEYYPLFYKSLGLSQTLLTRVQQLEQQERAAKHVHVALSQNM